MPSPHRTIDVNARAAMQSLILRMDITAGPEKKAIAREAYEFAAAMETEAAKYTGDPIVILNQTVE